MKIEEIKVELVPHVGISESLIGKVEVELPQKVVMVNGVWAGYVGNAPGSHISIILTNLPTAVLDEIKRQVDALRESPTSQIAQAKTLEQSIVKTDEKPATSPLSDLGL